MFSLQNLSNSLANGVNSFRTSLNTPPVGQAPPAGQAAPAAAPAATDQMSWANFTGGTPAPAAPAHPDGPESVTLGNKVQMTKYYEHGAQTAMQAVVPGMLGGGSLLPAPMLIQAHTNAQGQIDGAVGAEFLGKDGKPLEGADGKPQVMQGNRAPDGNIYFQTDANPNSPLAMFSEDGSYGITSRPTAQPNAQGVFYRDREETVEADGSRTMKFGEHMASGPQVPQAPQGFIPGAGALGNGLLGGLGALGGLGVLANRGPVAAPGSSTHHYTEVRVDTQNHLSASIVDESLLPGQKSPGAATSLGGIFQNATPFGAFAGGPRRFDTPLEATAENGVIHTEAASVKSKVFSALTGHGNLLQQAQQQQQGPADLHPFSTNELATADGASAVYQTVAQELKAQSG